jgi:hypothetical protein
MYRFFLKASSDNIVHGINRDERIFVFLKHDFLEFINFQSRDDAVEHFLGFTGVAALSVQQRDAAPETVVEGRGDFLVLVRDNHDGVRFVEALDDDVNHL